MKKPESCSKIRKELMNNLETECVNSNKCSANRIGSCRKKKRSTKYYYKG